VINVAKEIKKKKGLSEVLLFVAFIFLIRGVYWVLFFVRSAKPVWKWGVSDILLFAEYLLSYVNPPWNFGDVLLTGFVILVFGSYTLAAAGILLRRRFAYYIALFLLLLEVLIGVSFLFVSPVMAAIGLSFAVLLIYLLRAKKDHFEEFDKTDKKVIRVFVGAVLIFLVSYAYALTLPPEEEYAKMVTQEAVEKGDWRVCEKLRYGKSDCIISVAVSKLNADLCEGVLDVNEKNRCYYYIGKKLKDGNICNKITDYLREYCFDSIQEGGG